MHEIDADVIVDLHRQRTDDWHQGPAGTTADGGLMALIEANHRHNFDLWHEEDRARREDQGFEYVYRAKRAIDRLNQARNDAIEAIDVTIAEAFGPFADDCPVNSETPGMVIDRLSILALKAYHMAEQTERTDADADHVAACVAKLKIIEVQRDDLAAALSQLLAEFAAGTRGFRLYRQFKMYNDPALNPQLYRPERG
jgi:hypothetical protein